MSTTDSRGLNAWQLTIQVHREFTHILGSELKEATGLDLREYEVLFYLSNAPKGELRLTDLSESLLLQPSAATRFFDRMERMRLIKRKPAKDDRRSVIVALTTHGEKRLEEAQPVYNWQVGRHFGQHLTDADVSTIDDALDRVLGALRERRTRTGSG